MSKRVLPLTDLAIRKAKAKEKLEFLSDDKPTRLSDGLGLYLLTKPSGTKIWRFDYQFEGKRLTMTIGHYPEVSLLQARESRASARSQLSNGINPMGNKAIKLNTPIDNSFESVAREWHSTFKSQWCAAWADSKIRQLEKEVFPFIGKSDIKAITVPELLAVIRCTEQRVTLGSAHYARRLCKEVYRYAIATGRCDRNIATDLEGALPPAKHGHRAAIIDTDELIPVLKDIDSYGGSFIVKSALRLLPMVFTRPNELTGMEWGEVALKSSLLNDPQWNIPAARMKMDADHIVPLCTQAVAILTEMYQLTGHQKHVFLSPRSNGKAISPDSLVSALRNMGYTANQVSAHGFRATARTLLDEVLHVRPDFIEHQLAHAVKDPNGRAYNRTSHLPERRVMMQQWADYLDELKSK